MSALEGVSLALLGRALPAFSPAQLSRWFSLPRTRARVVRHLSRRAAFSLAALDRLDLLRRTAESARLYGMDFYSVLSRGSQYRVEAVLLRRAHREGLIAPSPSREQVARQAALQVVPLILEPAPSGFYGDPVAVLDFQSLYPSVMIAYNMCFSTLIGCVRGQEVDGVERDTTGRLGAADYPEALTAQHVHAHARRGERPLLVSSGALFCAKTVRVGVVPRMLAELSATRQMLKRAMKQYRGAEDAVLRRVLDARQLAIKLLMNVTYGYAAAGYSGRMPLAELADAVVQRGRDTLSWAIREVTARPQWGARVVYGDTDSLFVLLRGRSVEAALALGEEISRYVTQRSPPEVLLKLEKVYGGCLLATMKRYVGIAHEGPGPGHFDAKGIELVRRDQCGLVAKLQEQALRILFATRDLSAVRAYLTEQWTKLHRGGGGVYADVQDFVFAKEVLYIRLHFASLHFTSLKVRLDHYRGAGPPGAVLARRMMEADPGAAPPHGWRVPYVVVRGVGGGGRRLVDLVVSPDTLMRRGGGYALNVKYYILKVRSHSYDSYISALQCINPALHRLLSLCGADVAGWYAAVPGARDPSRRVRYPVPTAHPAGPQGRQQGATLHTLERWGFSSNCCVLCSKFSVSPVCPDCLQDEAAVYSVVAGRLAAALREQARVETLSLPPLLPACSVAELPRTGHAARGGLLRLRDVSLVSSEVSAHQQGGGLAARPQ